MKLIKEEVITRSVTCFLTFGWHSDKLSMVHGCSYLHCAARNQYVLLIDVKVDMRDCGEVWCTPFIKVSDELKREVGQLVTVCGQDEGAGGWKPQRRPIKSPEDATARCHTVLGATRKAAPHTMAKGALLLCLTAAWVTLDQVSSDALAAFGAVTVPKQLFRLNEEKFLLKSELNYLADSLISWRKGILHTLTKDKASVFHLWGFAAFVF